MKGSCYFVLDERSSNSFDYNRVRDSVSSLIDVKTLGVDILGDIVVQKYDPISWRLGVNKLSLDNPDFILMGYSPNDGIISDMGNYYLALSRYFANDNNKIFTHFLSPVLYRGRVLKELSLLSRLLVSDSNAAMDVSMGEDKISREDFDFLENEEQMVEFLYSLYNFNLPINSERGVEKSILESIV